MPETKDFNSSVNTYQIGTGDRIFIDQEHKDAIYGSNTPPKSFRVPPWGNGGGLPKSQQSIFWLGWG